MSRSEIPERICFLGYGLHPPWDEGTRVVTRGLINALQSHPRIRPFALSTVEPGRERATEFPVEYARESALGRLAERAGFYRYDTDVPMMLRLGMRLRRKISTGDCDLVHAGFASHSIFSAIAGSSVPFIAHIFGRLKHQRLLRILNTRERIDAYVTTSTSGLAELAEADVPSGKRFYVPPIIEVESRDTSIARERFDLPQDDFIVGYIGNVNSYRFPFGVGGRLNDLAANDGFSAVIFTKQIEYEGLQRLPDLSVVRQSLSDEDKAMALSAPDVWLFPFDFPNASTAPVIDPPLTVLEAMGAGKAVVATRSLSIPDVIEHGETGFLHQPGDTEAIFQTIDQLRQQRGLAKDIGERAASFVSETFSGQRAVGALTDVYRTVG